MGGIGSEGVDGRVGILLSHKECEQADVGSDIHDAITVIQCDAML